MRRMRNLLVRLCSAVALALAMVLVVLPTTAKALDSEPYLSEAQAAIVCDQTGNVLWSLNPDVSMPPASITKIMTAMVALDHWDDLDVPCVCHVTNLVPGAQVAGYVATDTPTRRELLRVTLVYSANDAAIDIAMDICGSEAEFVELMNQKAAELGMVNTHFLNTHGLDEDGHYASVRDLMIMGRHALTHYPLIAETVQNRTVDATIDGQPVTFESTDELMEWYEGLLGIKTGSIGDETTFLGASQRNGVTLYTAVLGCATDEGRFTDTASLMDWAYQTYQQPAGVAGGVVLQVRPSALVPGAYGVLRAPWSQSVMLWPEGEWQQFGTTLPKGIAVSSGDVARLSWWRQQGRLAGGTSTTFAVEGSRTPSVNVFALPLFAEDSN